MPLDKAIKYGKEKRNPYRPVSGSCCNHGGCSYCLSNRMIQTKRAKGKANLTEQEDEYFGYWFMPDPYDALQAEAEKNYRKLGIDPNDWETLVELGELIKG